MEKKIKYRPKIRFFEFIGKFNHYFFLNLVHNESPNYFLYPCTNPIFEKKKWILRYEHKMTLANQIAGFLNQLYMQNKMMKLFFHGFFVSWHKFMIMKNLLKILGIGITKNERSSLDMGNLLYLKNQLTNGLNLGKLKVTSIIIGWTWWKMDHGPLKSGISPKLFDKLSRSIEWFLHAHLF